MGAPRPPVAVLSDVLSAQIEDAVWGWLPSPNEVASFRYETYVLSKGCVDVYVRSYMKYNQLTWQLKSIVVDDLILKPCKRAGQHRYSYVENKNVDVDEALTKLILSLSA